MFGGWYGFPQHEGNRKSGSGRDRQMALAGLPPALVCGAVVVNVGMADVFSEGGTLFSVIMADVFGAVLLRARDGVTEPRNLTSHRLGIRLIVPDSDGAAGDGDVHLGNTGHPPQRVFDLDRASCAVHPLDPHARGNRICLRQRFRSLGVRHHTVLNLSGLDTDRRSFVHVR